MIPRDRVIATLNHEEPDRVPIDLGSTVVTSIGRDAYEQLRASLGLPPHELEIVDIVQQLPRVCEDLLEALGVELRAVGPNGPSTWKLDIKDERHCWSYIDEWGSKLEMPKQDGHYFDWVEFPLKESTLDALAALAWPNPDDPARYAGIRARAQRAYDAGYALVGTPPLGSDLLAMPQRTRGYAESMLDLAADEAFVEAFVDRLLDIALRAWGHFLDEVGDLIQVAVTFEDLGTQITPLISPAQYRRILKPRQRKIVDFIKSRSKAKVFLHSCGAVAGFIPDFLDIGIDILNPVQVTAVGLEDTAKLKRDWGKHLTFWGGACATTTLAFGSVEDVRAEAAQRTRDLMPGGGFIFAAVHNIQPDIPADKVRAMFDAAREAGEYGVRA